MKRTLAIMTVVAVIAGGAWLILDSASQNRGLESSGPSMLAPAGMSKDSGSERAPIAWAPRVTVEATGPTHIDLSIIPAGIYDPSNQLDSGRIPGRIESPLPEEEVARLRAEAEFLPPDDNIQIMAPGGGSLVAGPSFDSLDVTECCGGGTSVPPDPELAVGTNHIIAVVNIAFEIYDKAGTSLTGAVTFSSFFSANPGFPGSPFDPNVLYDEGADRWYIGIDADGTDFCFAVTQTPDPTAAWYSYCFATDIGGAFFDYPHSGIGNQAIYMGSNQFGTSFEGRIWAIDKDDAYAGLPITVPSFSTGGDGTPQPGHLRGETPTMEGIGVDYFMTDNFDGCVHNMWSIDDPFGTPTVTQGGDLNFCTSTGVAGGFPVDWPQAGSANLLQANDWRNRGMEYRNGLFYTTDSISCNPGGGTVNCARWAIVDPAFAVATEPEGVAIVDSGVVASNGEHRTFPSIAANVCGDIVLGYSKGSTGMFPSTFVTGRQSGDAPGTMEPEQVLKMGEIAYSAFDGAPFRWGDYTGTYSDPDGVTFWYLGEYSKDTPSNLADWGNYIGSFAFPDCTTGSVFADGFETGDTSAWSSTTP